MSPVGTYQQLYNYEAETHEASAELREHPQSVL